MINVQIQQDSSLKTAIYLKGIIDCDFTNYKYPVLTLEFPACNFKCDKLNGCPICQNSNLILEPDITVPFDRIWEIYIANPLTKGFCCQGLEPFDTPLQLFNFISYIRKIKACNDVIIIYTGYDKSELFFPFINQLINVHKYKNIIIKWGRFIMNNTPHYDEVLGVNLASDNQYAEVIS